MMPLAGGSVTVRTMWSRGPSIGEGAIAALFGTTLFLGNACSGDRAEAEFEPIAGTPADASGGGSGSGSTGMAGSGAPASSGGSLHQAGATSSDSDGTGEPNGGTDGSGEAGFNSGGGAGGPAAAGAAGTPGMSGAGTGNGGAGATGNGGGEGTPGCTLNLEVCDGVDNDCDHVVDEGQTCASGCFGGSYSGHRYAFCNVAEGATQALARCQSMSMTLLTIESAEENDFVVETMPDSSWIGASDSTLEDRWEWLASGEVFWDDGPVGGKFHFWLEDQPNNKGEKGTDENCAIIIADTGRWNDLNCELSGYGAACEALSPSQQPTSPSAYLR